MGFGLLASHLPGAMLQGQPAGLYFQHLRYRDGMNDCIAVITVRWEARWEQVKTLGSVAALKLQHAAGSKRIPMYTTVVSSNS